MSTRRPAAAPQWALSTAIALPSVLLLLAWASAILIEDAAQSGASRGLLSVAITMPLVGLASALAAVFASKVTPKSRARIAIGAVALLIGLMVAALTLLNPPRIGCELAPSGALLWRHALLSGLVAGLVYVGAVAGAVGVGRRIAGHGALVPFSTGIVFGIAGYWLAAIAIGLMRSYGACAPS